MLETIRNSFAFRWRRIRTELTNAENRRSGSVLTIDTLVPNPPDALALCRIFPHLNNRQRFYDWRKCRPRQRC
jgi:hypothetical protein